MAKVTGASNTAVNWSIKEGAAGGTISASGLYTAPATAGTYHVIATSQADTTKSATLAVTVTAVAVSVTAASATVYADGTDQFTAKVTGSSNTAVTWSIKEGSAGGTISATGLYTAPAAAGTYHVIATSQADKLDSASFAVAVTIPGVTFSSAPSTTLAEGATYTYAITATDPAGSAITYSLTTGPAGASISGGTLTWTPTAAELIMPSSFTVTAKDVLGTTNTQSWTVTPLRAVTMNIVDNFWASSGSSQSAIPAIPAPVGAIVPGSDIPLVAVISGDGTYYTIHNVPAGYYWLEDGPTEKHWTNTSTFDVGTDYVGQQLDGNATAMPVTFSSLAIDPAGFTTGEAIWVGSANANSWFAPATQPTTTTYTDTETIPLESPYGGAPTTILPALASADDSYVLEYEWGAPNTNGSSTYEGLSLTYSKAESSSFTYATPITGALTAASTPITMDVTMSGWPSLVPAAEPVPSSGQSATFFGVYLWAQPYTKPPLAAIGGGMPNCGSLPCATGLNGWPAEGGPEPATLLNAPHDARLGPNPGPLYVAWAERCQTGEKCQGAVNGDVEALSFASPFPSSYPYVLWAQQELSVPITGVPLYLFTAYSNSAYEFSSASAIPPSYTLSPAVEPVTSPAINGSNFFADSSPAAPLILSWGAAATNNSAKLAGYDVVVYALPPAGAAWGDALAKLYTTGTSLTIPTGLLSAGTYVFVLEAIADGSADVITSPYRSSYPKGTAQIVSGAITISGS